MVSLAIANLICLSGLALVHVVMGYLFYRYLTRTPEILLPGDFAPKVVVVLCLRGSDPFLRGTLLALMRQDYPNYSIKIIVDSRDDPSWAVVEDLASQSGRITFEFEELSDRPAACSLKCASIVQAVEPIIETAEVLVLADADVVPYERWLRDLIAPLSNPEIGVTTGNQWFRPTRGYFGSLVRNVWHAGAIIPTVLYRNPWAGSCAMRINDVKKSGLLDKWKSTIVDDGPIARAFQAIGKRIYVVPEVIIVNREECSISFCFTYIRRMLTWSRLYEKTFVLTPLHVFVMTASLLTALGLIVAGLTGTESFVPLAAASALGIFAGSLLIAYLFVDAAIVKVVNRRGEQLERAGPLRLLKLGCYFPVAIFIYAVVVLPAMFAKRIRWRGITYEIHGPWDVRLVDDRPYETESNNPSDRHDLTSV